MAIKTILVALALDEESGPVANRALRLAEERGAQLVALHVLEELPFQRPELPSSLDPEALEASLSEKSAEALGSLLEPARTRALMKVATGKPYTEILALAAGHEADLIVIGPGRAETLRERLFGSTADRVVRCAPCPVLVVRNRESDPYRHIAIGMDFSEAAAAAARTASLLAPSALHEFIHAIEIPLPFKQALLKAGAGRQQIEQYRRAKASAARQQMMEVFERNGQLPSSRKIRILQGDPARILLEATQPGRADLVALGTQGAKPLTRHLLGSVARKVLATAEGDVLVVSAAVA